MKYNFLIISIVITSFFLSAQSNRKADKDTQTWRYEIEALNEVGVQGTCLVKVWTYSKKIVTATEQAKKNAVHGLLFKGYAGSQRIPFREPIINNINAEVEYAEFFKSFFSDGGKFMKYVNVSGDAISAQDVYQVGKEYKVGVIVSVNIEGLRKDMEEAGIIKKMGSMF